MNAGHLVPRRRTRVRELGRLPVEEAVWRTGIGHDPMVDAGCREPGVERRHGIGGDALVRAAEQAQDGRRDRPEHVQRRRGVVPPWPRQRPVQPDDPGQLEAQGRRQERHPPAHAEPDREHGLRPLVVRSGLAAERGHGGLDVRGDAGPRRLCHMWRVREVGAPPGGPGRPPEPVDRERLHAPLREPQGELLVIRMEAADIGEHDHRGTGRRSRSRPERGEPVAVVGDQLHEGPIQGATRDRGDRWSAVVIEAHGGGPLSGSVGSARNRATIE